MYSGFVLFCNKTTLRQCLSRRLYTCADSHTEDLREVKRGSVLFLYDSDTKNLVGPFTAADEGASRIETGAWRSEIDEHSASANVKVEWEDLHIIKNAEERFPFLNQPQKCQLSSLQVQTLLDALKEATVFQG